jgi:hypothetical protein
MGLVFCESLPGSCGKGLMIASVPATPVTLMGYAGRNQRNGVGCFPEHPQGGWKTRSATVGVLVWD